MIYSTMTEAIETSKSNQLSHRALSNTIYINNVKTGEIIKCPFNHIIAKYRDLFGDNLLEIELTEKEQNRYEYNPRLVSYDLYGTVEYWSIILYLNEVGTALDFHPVKLRALLPENITELLNEILGIQQTD